MYLPLLQSYITNIKVYYQTTLEKRMVKAVKGQVKMITALLPKEARDLHGVLVDYITRHITSQESPAWKEKRKALVDKFMTPALWTQVDTLVQEHRGLLPTGGFNAIHIKKHVFDYIPYLQYLQGFIDRKFAVLPQWDAKARHLRINSNSLPAFFYYVKEKLKKEITTMTTVHDAKENKITKKVTKKQLQVEVKNQLEDFIRVEGPASWSIDERFQTLTTIHQGLNWTHADAQHVIECIWDKPPRLTHRQSFEGSLTTNLTQICWTISTSDITKTNTTKLISEKRSRVDRTAESERAVKRRKTTAAERKKVLKRIIPLMAAKDLKPGLYNHGQDFFLTNCSDGERPINFIDPGHANLMYGVYDDPRKKKFDPMDKTNRWHLTNARYQTETGQRKRRIQSEHHRLDDSAYQAACEDLAEHTAKTWNPNQYIEHIVCYARHWGSLFDHAFLPYQRIFRQASYQARQRIIRKIATELTRGDKRTVVVVGNGVKIATSHGYDTTGKHCGDSCRATSQLL